MNSSQPSRITPTRRAKNIAMEKIKKIIEDEQQEEVLPASVAPAIVADNSSSEDNDIGSAHAQQTPTTPKHQPTKPASTNAPERPPKLTIEAPQIKCRGCLEEQFNQLAHVGVGGCLSPEEYADMFANDYEYDRVQVEKYDEHNYDSYEPVKYEEEYKCPCYVEGCPGDCGTLWCGCIDVCRGRCGLRDPRDRY